MLPIEDRLNHSLSEARFGRYLVACKQDTAKAVRLYELNFRVARAFYVVQGHLEIALRNAINEHYINQFGTADWITLNNDPKNVNGLFRNEKLKNRQGKLVSSMQVDKAVETIVKRKGAVLNCMLLPELTFGFWVEMFNSLPFKIGGKTLMRIWAEKPSGKDNGQIYNDLKRVNDWRNRVAHYEPLVFDSLSHIGTRKAQEIAYLLNQYAVALDIHPRSWQAYISKVYRLCKEVNKLRMEVNKSA